MAAVRKLSRFMSLKMATQEQEWSSGDEVAWTVGLYQWIVGWVVVVVLVDGWLGVGDGL